MTDADLVAQLAGGDRRSIGRADAVAARVLREPALFPALWCGLDHADPLVRMRSADALEKVTRRRPDLLMPYQSELLRLLADATQMEVRWHLVQMTPRLPLTPDERDTALVLLKCHLTDASRIVKTCAMQAITDLSADDRQRREEVIALLEDCVQRGSPAMKSRGRKLLAGLTGATNEKGDSP